MRGTMLWFNGEKDLGVIEAEDGERLSVHGAGFAPGAQPTGRCGGTPVAFSVVEGDERKAVAVTLVTEVVPRRARRRRGGSFS
jgi:cold shock CspA family protein